MPRGIAAQDGVDLRMSAHEEGLAPLRADAGSILRHWPRVNAWFQRGQLYPSTGGSFP